MGRKDYSYNVRVSFMPRWRSKMPWRFRLPFIRRQVDKIVDFIADEAYEPMGDVYGKTDVSAQVMSRGLRSILVDKSKQRGYGTIWLSLALMVLRYVLPLLLEWWLARRESSSTL